ncbi:MAG: DUF1624 domain-containing protein [Acidaminococcus sp.]|jgi:uncharacterized membrane protein|nr:DUF1624 domain-containing protein [Acidaminococcus sp.]MCI2099574.1 DUF1624 domain-containing protein [Acidaminococcus sp.]MCI2113659.1 DUF1624 domain-containing protein [Acidaminococcus sp.]MCI2115742.1 DUF1624 domain-containing protein [Acidaminococcus sp.]
MRYALIDSLRGFSLVSMVLYHYCWDLVYLSGRYLPGYTSTPGYIWQQSICWAFIFISGFSLTLAQRGKKRTAALKKALLLTALGMMITAVTTLFMPEDPIWFGVLFFLGAATLIMPAFGNRTSLSAGTAFFLSLLLFAVSRNVPFGLLGFERLTGPVLPPSLYTHGLWGAFLGFPYKNFISADYFPLIPWIFLFSAGYFLGRALLKENELPAIFTADCPPLSVIGKHSLLIYLIHQPVLLLVVPGYSPFVS